MVLSAFMLSSSAPAPTPADSADDNPGNNLHVAPLSRDTQDADLDALFSRFGPLLKAQVMRDPHSRLVRGFGFVTFERPEDARAAIDALNGHELHGRALHVTLARRARARPPTPGKYLGPPRRDSRRRPPLRTRDSYVPRATRGDRTARYRDYRDHDYPYRERA